MINIVDAADISADDLISMRDERTPDVSSVVGEIINDIKLRGDLALGEYTLRFDQADLSDFKVSDDEIKKAVSEVGVDFLEILKTAAENIRLFHEKQRRDGFNLDNGDGVIMGQRILPLERVGVYIPGGTAPYPSTVLMDIIPAKVAGVGEVLMITPPKPDKSVDAGILAAASIAGADRIFKAGGAQAIAAFAYGTKTIPKVDKIVGPGNIFVATAKKIVYGVVDIDMTAGPSDILIIADSTADPVFIASDMLAQSEHDENAAAVLLTPDIRVAEAVKDELAIQLENLQRKHIAEASLRKNGRIILTGDIAQAIDFSNALAPEHLELCIADPFALLNNIKNAASVFLGNYTPEVLGDYFAGPNHTLPTMGSSRFFSPLSVDDFIKKSSYLSYSDQALSKCGDMVECFAMREGLYAHAKSIAARTRRGV